MRSSLRHVTAALLVLFCTIQSAHPNSSGSDTVNHNQLHYIIIIESATAVTTLAGLAVLWYAGYPQSSFHFINDNGEWLQMDK
jgi:hypothetical protein